MQRRQNEVLRENAYLFEKLSAIEQRSLRNTPSSEFFPGRVRLTKNQLPLLDIMPPRPLTALGASGKESTSMRRMRREHARILEENLHMLERLRARKATYSVREWDAAHAKSFEDYRRFASKNNNAGHLPRRTRFQSVAPAPSPPA